MRERAPHKTLAFVTAPTVRPIGLDAELHVDAGSCAPAFGPSLVHGVPQELGTMAMPSLGRKPWRSSSCRTSPLAAFLRWWPRRGDRNRAAPPGSTLQRHSRWSRQDTAPVPWRPADLLKPCGSSGRGRRQVRHRDSWKL